jgi:hypothetical protein
MASYTYTQLYGTGSIGENLSGTQTFTFTNPSGSSYLVMETIVNNQGVYDASTPTNFKGTYSVSESMGLVTSSYVAAIVVQPGSSTFTFTPTTAVTGTTYYLRGTGMYSLVIS